METLEFVQEKPIKVKLVGILLLVFVASIFFLVAAPLLQMTILFIIAVVLLGYKVIYRITNSFENKKEIQLYGVPIMRFKLDLEFPEYISVFATSTTNNNEWSTVSAIGKTSKTDRVVLRFFIGNKHFTVFETRDYKKAIKKGTELSELIGVELITH